MSRTISVHDTDKFESLFLTRIVERAGSGILDMIELCAESGLRLPEFRQDGGSFIQTLWRPVQSGSIEERGATQSTTLSEIQAHLPMFRLTEVLEDHNLSAGQLREALEIKHRPIFRKNYRQFQRYQQADCRNIDFLTQVVHG